MNQMHEKIVAFLDPETIEPQAKEQLYNIAKMPFVFKHLVYLLALMCIRLEQLYHYHN